MCPKTSLPQEFVTAWYLPYAKNTGKIKINSNSKRCKLLFLMMIYHLNNETARIKQFKKILEDDFEHILMLFS